MIDLSLFFGKDILNLEPKVPIDSSHKYRLCYNESPFNLDENLKIKVLKTVKSMNWNLYPTGLDLETEILLSNTLNISHSNLLIESGSSSALYLIAKTFWSCKFIIPTPSFPLYKYLMKIYSIEYSEWELDSKDEYNLDNLPPNNTDYPEVILICSPNNPIGNIISEAHLIQLLETRPRALIIVDEAYVEFSNQDFLHLLKRFKNLIILRTFSKAIGVASARLGYIIGDSNIISQLRKLRPPMAITPFKYCLIKEILNSNNNYMVNNSINISTIVMERDLMYNELVKKIDKIKIEITKISEIESSW